MIWKEKSSPIRNRPRPGTDLGTSHRRQSGTVLSQLNINKAGSHRSPARSVFKIRAGGTKGNPPPVEPKRIDSPAKGHCNDRPILLDQSLFGKSIDNPRVNPATGRNTFFGSGIKNWDLGLYTLRYVF